MPTTYFRLEDNGVARIVDEPGHYMTEIFSRNAGTFVPMPELFGVLTGAGGDVPPDEITEEHASALIGAPPRVDRLDGPGSVPDYSGASLRVW